MSNEQLKTEDHLDSFFEKLNQAIDIITEKTTELAPEALDITLSLIRAKGLFEVVFGIVAVVAALWLRKLSMPHVKQARDDFSDSGSLVFAMFLIGMCLLSSVVALAQLLSFSTWLKVISPIGFIAYEALKAVGVTI